MAVDNQAGKPTLTDRIKRRWPLVRVFGSEWCGNYVPPGDYLTRRFEEKGSTHCYSVGDDAFVLWMGYPDEWRWSVARREARQLAWFILMRWWAWAEWFGLRRWLYYFALRRDLKRQGLGA
jgi:hypothetical protein